MCVWVNIIQHHNTSFDLGSPCECFWSGSDYKNVTYTFPHKTTLFYLFDLFLTHGCLICSSPRWFLFFYVVSLRYGTQYYKREVKLYLRTTPFLIRNHFIDLRSLNNTICHFFLGNHTIFKKVALRPTTPLRFIEEVEKGLFCEESHL